jgi:hypothetical protein
MAAAAVVIPAIACEVALSGAKLQTAFNRVLGVWLVCYVGTTMWLAFHGWSGLAAATVFWLGSFVLWFGVRSHIESSILLRMLFLLRRRPMTDAQLVDAYTSVYGESRRTTELCRGGFVGAACGRMRVTSKGKVILLLASKFR